MTNPISVAGARDGQTVTKAGVPTAAAIDGVKTRSKYSSSPMASMLSTPRPSSIRATRP